MDMIDRYVYAVTRHLPPKQRNDIEKELRSLIEDMLQQRTGAQTPQAADIEAVLTELGDPRKMADNYRGTSRYLIGPAFFDIYWLVLRIVLFAAGFGILVATAVEMAVHSPINVGEALGQVFGGLYNGLLGAFGMVTLIFALNERYNIQSGEKLQNAQIKWQPKDLPAIPSNTLRIKRSDPIVSIIFTLIFLIIINIDLNVFGAYIQDGDQLTIIPIFSDYFLTFLPWINISMILTLILESIKLLLGRWTIPLALGCIGQRIFGLVIGLKLFADTRLFNPNFFTDLGRIFKIADKITTANPAAKICQVITILIIIGFVIDVLTIGWKMVKIVLERKA